ncbi:MAG: energy transducer TonB [Pseudomonadota bacterium]
MKSASANKKESRLLLTVMLILSLGVHLALFWGFSSVLMFKTHIVSDLTFENLAQPPPRVIPRPRPTSREPTSLDDIKDVKNFKASAPAPSPPVDASPRSSGQPSHGASFAGMSAGISAGSEGALSVPSVPGVSVGNPGMHISQWNPGGIGEGGGSDFSSSRTYFEIVKLKIEKNKKYPEEAKKNHMEGTVSLKFIITPDGTIRNTEVAKSSRHPMLDDAAIKALKDAAPFPKPPERFFKGEVPLQISIIFELT